MCEFSYGSGEKYGHVKRSHHHPYYMSKIRYTGKSEPVQGMQFHIYCKHSFSIDSSFLSL